MSKITIGVTGHRALSDEQKDKIRPLVLQAVKDVIAVSKEHDAHCSFVALSALAEGADALFAEVALTLHLRLVVILPFEERQYLETFSSDENRAEFKCLYAKADEKIILNTHDKNDEPQLYLAVGQKIADDSDFLFAIWNEGRAKGKGGTAEIVAYATEKGKKILLINPEMVKPYIQYM